MGVVERREREKNIRRKQILEAAEKVFAAKGFAGATMEDIAQQAELSPATFYLYFKNKEELYTHLNLRILRYATARLEHLHKKNGLGPEQKLEAERIIGELTASGVWLQPIVTEVKRLAEFYAAEEYHHQYYRRNPEQGYCQVVIAPKLDKFRQKFVAKLREP